MSRPKELRFFTARVHRARGVDWYRRQFDAGKPIRGESSPSYTADALPSTGRRLALDPYFPGVPERMHSLIPDAKLIYMVRDPVERIRAQWSHLHARGFERRPLELAISRPGSTYLPRSRYGFQLEGYLEHYPRDRIMVVDQQDLFHRRRETLAAVFRFLGIEATFWDPSYEQLSHVTSDRRRRTGIGFLSEMASERLQGRSPFSRPFEPPEISEALRRRLVARLSAVAARFRSLAGRRFQHWSL